jgi:hypothetical protein
MEDYLRRRSLESGVSFEKMKVDPLESEILLANQRAVVAYPIIARLIQSQPTDETLPWCCSGRFHQYVYEDMPARLNDF